MNTEQKSENIFTNKFVLYGQRHIFISLWYYLAFFVDQKWKSKIYMLRKVDDRILTLQLARSRSKSQKENDVER